MSTSFHCVQVDITHLRTQTVQHIYVCLLRGYRNDGGCTCCGQVLVVLQQVRAEPDLAAGHLHGGVGGGGEHPVQREHRDQRHDDQKDVAGDQLPLDVGKRTRAGGPGHVLSHGYHPPSC